MTSLPTASGPAPTDVESEIRAMVDRETSAWNTQDADALVDLFHPDMVWAWPPDASSHDPVTWVLALGRYNRDRWRASWQELFRTHDLLHNRRTIVRVAVSDQGDGAFAVVDVDTLWRLRTTGALFPWKGRACKGYTRLSSGWKLIFHTGLLDYGAVPGPAA